jgi:hypothetical protein
MYGYGCAVSVVLKTVYNMRVYDGPMYCRLLRHGPDGRLRWTDARWLGTTVMAST